MFELVRLRLLGDLPIAVDENRLPHARVEGIERIDFARESLYDALRREFDIAPTRADYVVEAIDATHASRRGCSMSSRARRC